MVRIRGSTLALTAALLLAAGTAFSSASAVAEQSSHQTSVATQVTGSHATSVSNAQAIDVAGAATLINVSHGKDVAPSAPIALYGGELMYAVATEDENGAPIGVSTKTPRTLGDIQNC